jgi:hypothetical protein
MTELEIKTQFEFDSMAESLLRQIVEAPHSLDRYEFFEARGRFLNLMIHCHHQFNSRDYDSKYHRAIQEYEERR